MTSTFFPQTIDLSASAVQLIRTALNNPKVTFDKTGLKAFDANGNPLFTIDAVSGTATLHGDVVLNESQTTLVENDMVAWLGPGQSEPINTLSNPAPLMIGAQKYSDTVADGTVKDADLGMIWATPARSNLMAVIQMLAGFSGNTFIELEEEDSPSDPNENQNSRVTIGVQGAGRKTLLDGNGISSFSQLSTSRKRLFWPQQGAILSIAGNSTQNVVFNNAAWTLGSGDMAVVFLHAYFDQRFGGWLDHCSWSLNAMTPTSFTIGVANLQANTASGSIQVILETGPT